MKITIEINNPKALERVKRSIDRMMDDDQLMLSMGRYTKGRPDYIVKRVPETIEMQDVNGNVTGYAKVSHY